MSWTVREEGRAYGGLWATLIWQLNAMRDTSILKLQNDSSGRRTLTAEVAVEYWKAHVTIAPKTWWMFKIWDEVSICFKLKKLNHRQRTS